jgi:hypothetical protein
MASTADDFMELDSHPLATSFTELLGEKLSQHNESNNETNEISTNELDGKHVGLYFASV